MMFAVGNVLNFVSFGEHGLNFMLPDHKLNNQTPLHSRGLRWGSEHTACIADASLVCDSGFAAQSLLAALGSVQFVCNVIFGYWLLHERVTLRVILATASIVAGCIVLVIFGNHASPRLTSPELQALYHQPGAHVALVAPFVLLRSAGASDVECVRKNHDPSIVFCAYISGYIGYLSVTAVTTILLMGYYKYGKKQVG